MRRLRGKKKRGAGSEGVRGKNVHTFGPFISIIKDRKEKRTFHLANKLADVYMLDKNRGVYKNLFGGYGFLYQRRNAGEGRNWTFWS